MNTMRRETWTASTAGLEVHVVEETVEMNPPFDQTSLPAHMRGQPIAALPPEQYRTLFLLVGRPGEALAELRDRDLDLLRLALNMVRPSEHAGMIPNPRYR